MLKLVVLLFVAAALARDIPGKNFLARLEGNKLTFLRNAKDASKTPISAKIVAPSFDLEKTPEDCEEGSDGGCFIWRNIDGNAMKLTIKADDDDCVTMAIEGRSEDEFGFYFNYTDLQWYGGPERYQQEWPVQKIKTDGDEPYVTRETNAQAVLEPYWLTSAGDVIFVNSYNSSLFFNSNSEDFPENLGLVVADRPPYNHRDKMYLEFDECTYGDPVVAHRKVIEKYLGKPTEHPGERMMTYPTYSTWAKYKRDINQDKVLEFTNKIIENNYLLGTIEIDDKWETCYGSLLFDAKKFPNIKQLTDYIHSKGGRVTVWVTPFINTDCDFYEPALNEGRLILNQNGSAITRWWNGVGGVVDVTNKTTKDWWVGRLKSVMDEAGLDGFKFDAGETSFLPQLPQIIGDPQFYPETYVRNYVEACKEFGSNLEARVGRNTQDVALFIRMLDKDSRWGLNNGLQTIITTSLQMSLAGYPFILPDMIGGNAYGETPSKELFIRWTQANALLPAMQFSLLPWDYDQETVDIIRTYLDLHTNYTETFLKVSQQAIDDGTPIITPVWWVASQDPEAHPINDQFMLGPDILVAPVVTEGSIQRDVYLPNGIWTDNRQEIYAGPVWLRNYSAPLDYLPIFKRNL